MNRSDVLRDLYEALEMLDARQASRPATVAIDLRDADGGLLNARLSHHEPRVALRTDWDLGGAR